MPLIQTPGLAFPAGAQRSGAPQGVPSGFLNELVVSELLGRYATLVKSNKVFVAYATLTAPVIYTTAAGTGGPLLWNKPSSGVDAHLLALGFSSSVVTTVAGGLGITGNAGQTVVPTSTTAIDASGSTLIGGAVTQMGGVFRVGTPTNAGNILFPIAQFHTGALTADTTGMTWMDLGGIFVCPPGSWISPAGTATLTTLQVQVGLIWTELPN